MPRSCSLNDMNAAFMPFDPRTRRPAPGGGTTRREPRRPQGHCEHHRSPARRQARAPHAGNAGTPSSRIVRRFPRSRLSSP
jgi:hypothetical protein